MVLRDIDIHQINFSKNSSVVSWVQIYRRVSRPLVIHDFDQKDDLVQPHIGLPVLPEGSYDFMSVRPCVRPGISRLLDHRFFLIFCM